MIPEYVKEQAKIELARRIFWNYCKLKAPDFYKEDRAFLKDMCNRIQDFINSDKKILVINMPPRHGKSRTATLLVQWLLGNDSKRKIMTGSYNETLSTTFAKQVRDSILETDGIFSKVFPETKIKYGESTMNKWALDGNEEANYLATSPTGTATGFGCFPRGTKICTDKGIINIEDLYNDKTYTRVLSFDFKCDKIRYNKIKAKRKLISNENIEFITNTGRKIISTRDHIFYTEEDGYIRADKIKIGRTIKTIDNKFKMRKMWKDLPKTNLRSKKVNKKRICPLLFFKGMFLQNKCFKSKNNKILFSLQKRNKKEKQSLLFKNMQSKSKRTHGKYNLPNMFKRISTTFNKDNLLFNEVQKQSSFRKNERQKQFKLQKWRKLFKRVSRYKTIYKAKRQLSMSNMWTKRKVNETQEIWINNEFTSSSHKRKYKRQFNKKLNYFMSRMSYKITQNEKIVGIRNIDKEMEVYDIQVDKDENFYANGVLVHNCNLMIIDDLLKNSEEAYNENTLNKHIDWFNNTMLSRTETGFKLVIIMTRWASNDLAGYILENYKDVEHINYKAIQDDGSMLCDDILSKEDFEFKTKNMNKDIIEANYQQCPIDIKGKLYSKFLTYELDKIPKFKYIMNYTDTADEGSDNLCSIDYGVDFNNQMYILDILYTKEPMEITEPLQAKMMTKDNVGYSKIESNNGGRGYARNVERELKSLGNRHTKVDWFHQSENKIARILSNSTGVMNNVFFPENWATRFPEYYRDMNKYQREGKNEHDDAPDCTTGVYENKIPRVLQFGSTRI